MNATVTQYEAHSLSSMRYRKYYVRSREVKLITKIHQGDNWDGKMPHTDKRNPSF